MCVCPIVYVTKKQKQKKYRLSVFFSKLISDYGTMLIYRWISAADVLMFTVLPVDGDQP